MSLAQRIDFEKIEEIKEILRKSNNHSLLSELNKLIAITSQAENSQIPSFKASFSMVASIDDPLSGKAVNAFLISCSSNAQKLLASILARNTQSYPDIYFLITAKQACALINANDIKTGRKALKELCEKGAIIPVYNNGPKRPKTYRISTAIARRGHIDPAIIREDTERILRLTGGKN